MSIIVSLDAAPETHWWASNALGRFVLGRAEDLAVSEEAREQIRRGVAFHGLAFDTMKSPLREEVWDAVETAAKKVSAEPLTDDTKVMHPKWREHVAELASEMEARRLSPDRPGIWK